MSMQDSISDMLTRIRNAQLVKKMTVDMPRSKMKVAIAEVMLSEGYIDGFTEVEGTTHPTMRIQLRYYEGRPVIEDVKRVSRPGLRIHRGKEDLPKVNGGLGIAIVSTNQGVMTDREARRKGLGGEVICTIS